MVRVVSRWNKLSLRYRVLEVVEQRLEGLSTLGVGVEEENDEGTVGLDDL